MLSDELLTSGQVAEETGYDRTTVHYWVRTGKLIPSQTVNGIRLFARTEVDRFIADRATAKAEAQS